MKDSEFNFERFDYFDSKHKNILLAEDNLGDIEIFKDNCEETKYPCSLFVVNNGDGVVDFLRSSNPMPDLIVLDINMPALDGIETLSIIKSQDLSKNIPVIMLTSSSESNDIRKAQSLGANGYIVKASNFNISDLISFIEMAKQDSRVFIEFSGNQ